MLTVSVVVETGGPTVKLLATEVRPCHPLHPIGLPGLGHRLNGPSLHMEKRL